MSYLVDSKRRRKGNLVEPLVDGEDVYRSLQEQLKKAKKYIYLVTWNLEPGMTLVRDSKNDESVEKILVERAKAGVEVKVLVWDVYSLLSNNKINIDFLQKLIQKDNLRLKRKLNTTKLSDLILDANEYKPSGRVLKTGSHHQKIWIMDDGDEPRGFVGGMNITDHAWDTDEHKPGDPRRKPTQGWRKFLFDIKDDLSSKNVKRVLRAMTVIDSISELLATALFSNIFASGKNMDMIKRVIKALIILELSKMEPYGPWHDITCKMQGPILEEVFDEFSTRWGQAKKGMVTLGLPTFSKQKTGRGAITVQVGHTAFFKKPGKKDDILRAYVHAIGKARSFMYFENQYFTSDTLARAFVKALKKNRNLYLVVVIPDKAEDIGVGPAITQKQFEIINLLKKAAAYRGGNAERVQIFRLAHWDAKKKEYEDIYVHAKIGIIDDRWVAIGSANINERGFFYDTEMNTFFDDKKHALEFRQKLWSEHSQLDQSDLKDPIGSIKKMIRQAKKNANKKSGELEGRILPYVHRMPSKRKLMIRLYKAMAKEFL